MLFGQKIRKVRELRNYTQEYMAEKLGITQETYSRIENEQYKLDIKRLDEIAKILNIDPFLLFNFDESIIFNNCPQSGKTVHNYNALAEKEKNDFIQRIHQLEAEIERLKKNLIN